MSNPKVESLPVAVDEIVVRVTHFQDGSVNFDCQSVRNQLVDGAGMRLRKPVKGMVGAEMILCHLLNVAGNISGNLLRVKREAAAKSGVVRLN
jgi:hypothetical protein